MNRKIRFRGMKENGKWIKGYYVRHETRALNQGEEKIGFDEVRHYIMHDSIAEPGMLTGVRIENVIPETVGQYVESLSAYEGDIILCYGENEKGLVAPWEGVIKYNKRKDRLMVQDMSFDGKLDENLENLWYEVDSVVSNEIVTNIHEGRVRGVVNTVKEASL